MTVPNAKTIGFGEGNPAAVALVAAAMIMERQTLSRMTEPLLAHPSIPIRLLLDHLYRLKQEECEQPERGPSVRPFIRPFVRLSVLATTRASFTAGCPTDCLILLSFFSKKFHRKLQKPTRKKRGERVDGGGANRGGRRIDASLRGRKPKDERGTKVDGQPSNETTWRRDDGADNSGCGVLEEFQKAQRLLRGEKGGK